MGQDLLNFSKTTSKIFCYQLYEDGRDKGRYAGVMTCGVCTLVVSSVPEHISDDIVQIPWSKIISDLLICQFLNVARKTQKDMI